MRSIGVQMMICFQSLMMRSILQELRILEICELMISVPGANLSDNMYQWVLQPTQKMIYPSWDEIAQDQLSAGLIQKLDDPLKRNARNQVWVNGKGLQWRICVIIHAGLGGSHLSIKSTLKEISKYFTWEGVSNVVKNLLSKCEIGTFRSPKNGLIISKHTIHLEQSNHITLTWSCSLSFCQFLFVSPQIQSHKRPGFATLE